MKKNQFFLPDESLVSAPKHPGLIRNFSIPGQSKIRENPLQFIGVDLETNYKTGELELIGIYMNGNYHFYTDNFIGVFYKLVKTAIFTNSQIVYWSKLDPFVIFKEFLLQLSPKNQKNTLERYQKISGSFDRKTQKWKADQPPLVSLDIDGKQFGIAQCIKSCYEFFIVDSDISKVWSYDISVFYKTPLAEVGKKYLPWYSKLSEDVHKLDETDWNRFHNDETFRARVCLSNEYDSRACHDLAEQVQNDFFVVFGCYPKSLISPGSLTRASYQAVTNKLYSEIKDPDEKKKLVSEELKSIGIEYHFSNWSKQLGEKFPDFLSLIVECYKGAKIECLGFGYVKEAYLADISGAYSHFAGQLYDLRNSKIVYGTGKSIAEKYSYTLIRGTVSIPKNKYSEFHTILCKHPFNEHLNICALGIFRVSYYLEEREWLEKLGATFQDEEWYQIQTEGKPSPLARIANEFIKMRYDLIAKNDPRQAMPKDCANSIYGVSFEAIMSYVLDHGEVKESGYRAGDYFNPLFAGWITMRCRGMLSGACVSIASKGGKIITLQTDSLIWEGSADMLDPVFWKENKTNGFFEKPEKIFDFVSLGAGRYEFRKENKKFVSKKRGLNLKDLLDQEGITLTEFSWQEAVKQNDGYKFILANVRTLISPLAVLMSKNRRVEDIGRVIDETREIDLMVGLDKRRLTVDGEMLKHLHDTMFYSEPLELGEGMTGTGLLDYTLPELRKKICEITYISPEDHKAETVKKAKKRYYQKTRKTTEPLTESQKRENRRKAQQKYYQKNAEIA
ncbi:MAG: hypothetical protein PHT24_07970 [Endomicrobiaceae bacterium]|nr:hypothetical protein [Endomicrobiaceae bacterium]